MQEVNYEFFKILLCYFHEFSLPAPIRPHAKKYLPKGASSLLSFVIDGDRAVATKFLENVKLLIHATNIGDTRTVVTYPALTTHRQLSAEQLEECGISESFIRLSVGIEDVEDIIADIDQALEKAMNT